MIYFRFYMIFMILSGFVFTKPVAAQAYLKLESRLVFSKHAAVQSYLKIEGAQVFSTFKFSTKNQDLTSPGNPPYSHTAASAFSIGYERVKSNGLFILAGIGIRKAGSALIYNNIDYTWNMQYIDVKVGLGYQLNKWPLKPYAAVLPYYAYLLDAKQSMGTNYFDIKASKSVKNNDLGLFMALGFKAAVSPYISIYTEYNYILGLQNIETTKEQYLYNRGFSFKLGIALTLTSFIKPKEDIVQAPTDSLSDTQGPGFITEIPSITLPPPTETSSSKNADDIKEVPVIENKHEIVENDLKSGNNVRSEALSNTVGSTKKVPVIEDQSEKEEDVELVKTTPSNLTKTTPSTTRNSTKDAAKSNNNSVSAKNKTEKESGARNRMPTKILFKIQIGLVSKPLGINHPLLKNVSGKIEKETGKDGKIRYYSGIFESYDEARSFLSIIKSKGGNEGAFVVAFKNGKQITVYEAKKLTEENE